MELLNYIAVTAAENLVLKSKINLEGCNDLKIDDLSIEIINKI